MSMYRNACFSIIGLSFVPITKDKGNRLKLFVQNGEFKIGSSFSKIARRFLEKSATLKKRKLFFFLFEKNFFLFCRKF